MTYRRYRYRYRRTSREHVIGAVLGVVLIAGLGQHATRPAAHAATAAVITRPGPGTVAIGYARAQLGKPYLWGGTGPDAFDCSGLVQQAYARAGLRLARTSQAQWATERHVTSPEPGDLVFFAGVDGTMTDPGHVGIVISNGRMIEAYGRGYPIRVASYDRPGRVGFTDPRLR